MSKEESTPGPRHSAALLLAGLEAAPINVRELQRLGRRLKQGLESGEVTLIVATDGAGLIVAERQRHVSQGGWTSEHDDGHDDGSLAGAAACLTVEGTDGEFTWPDYESSWIKTLRDKHARSSRVQQLKIAGALIAAEIDHIQRLAK